MNALSGKDQDEGERRKAAEKSAIRRILKVGFLIYLNFVGIKRYNRRPTFKCVCRSD
jgi:hypothetical protein